MSVLEGKTVKEGTDEVRKNFLTVYLVSQHVWFGNENELINISAKHFYNLKTSDLIL